MLSNFRSAWQREEVSLLPLKEPPLPVRSDQQGDKNPSGLLFFLFQGTPIALWVSKTQEKFPRLMALLEGGKAYWEEWVSSVSGAYSLLQGCVLTNLKF